MKCNGTYFLEKHSLFYTNQVTSIAMFERPTPVKVRKERKEVDLGLLQYQCLNQ